MKHERCDTLILWCILQYCNTMQRENNGNEKHFCNDITTIGDNDITIVLMDCLHSIRCFDIKLVKVQLINAIALVLSDTYG